jgi:hypothetical protein
MSKSRPHVPKGLPLTAVLLIVLGVAAYFLIQATATPEQLAQNVLLSALPFILIFVAIILLFATLIIFTSVRLSNNIAQRSHFAIEALAIAGILLGILGIFQPWVFALYSVSFVVLLISTLFFILWSHVQPKRTVLHEE